VKFGTSRLREAARAHLEADEEMLAAVEGVYEGELLGAEIPRNGVLVATQRRLLFYGKRLGGYDVESFPYLNISSFEQGRSLYGSYLHFFASGNRVEVKWIQRRRDLADLIGEVERRMGKDPGTGVPASPPPDVPTRLRELGKLYQEGLVTPEEYERKRTELLRLL
jgi:hypothetical protein